MKQSQLSISKTHLSPVETAEHNLKVADSVFHLPLFCVAARGWINAHDGKKNFQDLEKFLRSSNLNTHIIAHPPTTLKDVKFVRCDFITGKDLTNAVEVPYEVWFSCRPKIFAMQELLSFHSSYDENFANLEKSGWLISTKKDDTLPEGTEEDKVIPFSKDEIDVGKLVGENKVVFSLV